MLRSFIAAASKQPRKITFFSFSLSSCLQTGDHKEWTQTGYWMFWVKIILFYLLRMTPELRKLGSHCSSWISLSPGTTWASLTSCMSGLHLSVTSECIQFSSPMPEMTPSSLKMHEVWELQLLFNRNVWPICFCSYRLLVDTPVPSALM